MKLYLNSVSTARLKSKRFRPRSPYVVADPILRDQVYRRLVWLLADPNLAEAEAGETIALEMPLTRKAMESMGLSAREVELSIMEILEAATDPVDRYRMTRRVPSPLRSAMLKAGDPLDPIFDHLIVACPSEVTNAIVCEQLSREFSYDKLLSVPGFLEVDVLPDDDPYDEFEGYFVENPYRKIRLDLCPSYSRQGYIFPIFTACQSCLPIRLGRIMALRVFRRLYDEKPFILRSREVPLHA